MAEAGTIIKAFKGVFKENNALILRHVNIRTLIVFILAIW